jgi:hypothetical protein
MARTSLVIAGIIEIVFRGIPAMIGTPEIAAMFNLEFLPGFIPYVHAFGAVMITMGIMFLIASRVPERNTLVINMAILRFALGIVAQLWTLVQMGGLVYFWWIHMILDAVLVLMLLMARAKVMAKLA